MNSKQISTPVALAIGVAALVVILVLGYRIFLAQPTYQGIAGTPGQSSKPDAATAAHYPGGNAAGAPAPSTP